MIESNGMRTKHAASILAQHDSRDVFPAVATEFAVTEVVNDDENDIGTLLGQRGNSCECQGSDDCCE